MLLPLTQTETLALARAVQRNRQHYDLLRAGGAPGAPDYLVLTAANERQAAGYRTELAQRQRQGFLPPHIRVLVVPDPAGRRIGSGGATVHALRVVARDLWQANRTRKARPRSVTQLFRGRRILVVHAGGGWGPGAARGGLFARLPGATLFDELFVTLACMFERFGPGLLVASGDVLVLFDAGDVRPASGAVTGFAATAGAEQAVHHGVYAGGRGDIVRAFLHKSEEEALRAGGALDALGRARVDTGLVGFADRGLLAVAELAGVRVGDDGLKIRRSLLPSALGGSLNLYDDLLPALHARGNAAAGVGRDEPRRSRLQRLGPRFRQLDFHAQHLAPALFIHLGTEGEYRDAIAPGGPVHRILQANRLSRDRIETPPEEHRGEEPALTMKALRKAIAAEAPAATIVNGADISRGARRLRDALDQLSASSPPLMRARVEYAHAKVLVALAERATSLSKALRFRRGADRHEDAAFAAVGEALGAQKAADTRAKLAVPVGEAITVELPVRVDFGGGWSDTPPHSLDRGGAVLNAAVLLEDQRPVRASVRALRAHEVRLEARDLGCRCVITRKPEALAYRDPADPFALHKAALVLMGILRRNDNPLPSCLARFGGGIEIVTESRVPRGSGLGTSSILGACLVSALCRLCGAQTTTAALFDKVLRLEQMLTTGGGWQDQVGGLVPGIKLVWSEPGIPQRLWVERVVVPPAALEELQERLVLVYVGHRRLAKNILRAVMGGYLARDPETISILGRIREIAREMRQHLQNGDLDRFGERMREHWELNKRLDPHSTNAGVERVLSAAAPFAIGFKMVGAGGGGFAEILARGRDEAGRIGRAVTAAGGRVYRWAIAQEPA